MTTIKLISIGAGVLAALSVIAPAAATSPHIHQITAGNGTTHDIAVGLCNARWDEAGENFHSNVHFGGPNDSSGDPAISITLATLCPAE